MKFTWDEAKNRVNKRTHGVSFEEASELFRSGRDYLEVFDDEHSVAEDRFVAIGPLRHTLVLVVWTERDEETIRTISARWATKHEQLLYRSLMDETQ